MNNIPNSLRFGTQAKPQTDLRLNVNTDLRAGYTMSFDTPDGSYTQKVVGSYEAGVAYCDDLGREFRPDHDLGPGIDAGCYILF